jgi:glycosyltransferase involved in cell wall biosynthesis
MGYANCRDILGIDNTYIPLVVDDKGVRENGLPSFQSGVLTTCTAARSNKVEIPYFVSYLDVIPDLLAATGGRHVHIGRLTPWAIYKIRRKLRRKGVASERFVYIPWVSSVWQALHENHVDLYIASFPYGGGLTLVEAMGAGVPVALHRHMWSRILSGIDLGYPQAFNWRSPEELISYCVGLSPQSLAESGILSRQHYESFHSRDVLEAALHDVKIMPVPTGGAFHVDTDEWALWMGRQVSLKSIFNKFLYRLFRRARSWLYFSFRYK